MSGGGGGGGAGALKVLQEVAGELKEFISPEMIKALSPTEGFECTPHTFQATETEGRWKPTTDFGADRVLKPSSMAKKKPAKYRATIVTIEVEPVAKAAAELLEQMLLLSTFPRLSYLPILKALQSLQSALPEGTLTALPPASSGGRSQAMVEKAFPQIQKALKALLTASKAEIEAVWWSDGLEIFAGQVAPKHVRGFGSLFNHQARVEVSGVSFGNYFPLSYCVTFTGFVNPVGPNFEEFRGSVVVGADGSRTGMFCERSDRDKKEPELVEFDPVEGYFLKYRVLKS